MSVALMENALARIAQLEDRAAISDLIHRYAYNIRHGLHAACAGLFVADGAFETREAPLAALDQARVLGHHRGHEAISAYLARTQGARLCPMIQNILIDLDGDDASSSAVMSVATPDGATMRGEYRDTFRRDDGVWRFSQRIYTIFRAPADPS